ncbi:MAG: hypothetical protein D6715_02470 [Calditrichaeota bacterium]|nr:MAG: hypothetical protein D6715_02470 [Calditrichota bacterium]
MLKSLFRHSLVYGIASTLQNATGFILLPLYTSRLSVSEYGTLEIFLITAAVLTRILQLGLGSATFKYYAYSKSQGATVQNRAVISTAFYGLVGFSLTALGTLFFFRGPIAGLLFHAPGYEGLFTLTLALVFFQLLMVIPTSYLRILNRSVTLSVLNLLLFLVQIGLIVFFVALADQKIYGVLLGKLIAFTLFAGVFVSVVREALKGPVDPGVLKKMLSYGIFLVPVSICLMVLTMSNRYFLLFFAGSQAVGLFAAVNRIASLLLLAVSGFQMAWPSIMFSIRELDRPKQYYSRIFTYYNLVFLFLVLAVSLFSRELVLLLSTEDYLPYASLIPVLAAGYFFYGIFYAGSVGINIFNKTYFQSIAAVLAALSNLLLNIWLIPRYQVWGAALAHLASFVILGVLAMRFSQRIYPIPIQWARVGKLALVGGLFLLLGYSVKSLHPQFWVGVVGKMLILSLVFPGLLYILNFFDGEEKQLISQVIQRLRR